VGFDLGETLLFYRDTPLSWVSLYPQALGAVAAACCVAPSGGQLTAAEKILAQYNTRIVARTKEISADAIFSEILDTWQLEVGSNLQAAIDAFFKFFQQRMDGYPDVLPTLKALREGGIPVGVLTDVPYGMPRAFVERDIVQAGFTQYIDTLLTSAEVGLRKPEPDGYRALAKRLGVETTEMFYVGNEPKDVTGANSAGAISVFVDRNGSGENHGQAFTISSLSELLQIVSR
jgi:putative hydrolase of the HAD superfamily